MLGDKQEAKFGSVMSVQKLGYYQNIPGVLSEHTEDTTWYNHNLFENTIIIVPPPNIYYTFIVVMRQEIGWLATYLKIVVVLLEHTGGT